MSNAEMAPGKSANVTPNSVGSLCEAKSAACGVSDGTVGCGARPARGRIGSSPFDCEEPLCVRRFFAGGAELGWGVACEIRCDRSHSNVQLFFVFSQLPHCARGPKTSAKSIACAIAVSRLCETYRCNGRPLDCCKTKRSRRAMYPQEWPRRTPAFLSDTGRSIDSASCSSWKPLRYSLELARAWSRHNLETTWAERRRNS